MTGHNGWDTTQRIQERTEDAMEAQRDEFFQKGEDKKEGVGSEIQKMKAESPGAR